MRSKVVKTLALALVLSGGISLAQQPPAQPGQPQQPLGKAYQPGGSQGRKAPPEKSKLEEMLAEALKNNPDIRVAAAKLAEAEAQLNRTRLQVTQKVVLLHQAILSQKAAVDDAQKKYDRVKRSGAAAPTAQMDLAEEGLRIAKGKLAELEAQLPGSLGKSARPEDSAGTVRNEALQMATRHALEFARRQPDPNEIDVYRLALVALAANTHKTTGPMAERLRKALQTSVKVDYKDTAFVAILKDLEKKAPGLSFRNLFGALPSVEKIDLRFEEALPLSAILQALADETGCRFYVREYGILVAAKENMPPGALTVEEFLRHKPENNEYKEARRFILNVWPKLSSAQLEDSIPTAQKSFKTCRDVGDLDAIEELLKGTLEYSNRLNKRLSELHPELVIEDEKEAQRLRKLSEKLARFVAEIQNYLKSQANEK